MAYVEKANLESQLGSAPCNVEGTEEMFWLREADDYQSKVALGNALAAQYRFRDAIEAYRKALLIRSDDWTAYNRLAGACLTIRRFGEAMDGYSRCLALGAGEKAVAFPLGVWHYLSGDYVSATDWFEKCLPCGDELAIAAIYWHTLCCYRAGQESALLSMYHREMDVGHHTAYRLAVSVFSGETPWEEAAERAEEDASDLSTVIALYGLCGYLDYIGQTEKSAVLLKKLLKRDSCWPCISYLAAWNDGYANGTLS